jgi:hypothetical protein
VHAASHAHAAEATHVAKAEAAESCRRFWRAGERQGESTKHHCEDRPDDQP